MSARTVTVTLENNTGLVWTLKSSDTSSGQFTATPPQSLKQDPVKIVIVSDGMMTGAGGTWTYASGSGDFTFTVMNPYDGKNHHEEEKPNGYSVDESSNNGDHEDDWKLTLTARSN